MRPQPLRLFIRCFMFVAAIALVAGCGKPTLEGAVAGYKGAKDKLDALTAKVSPQTKAVIAAKVAEFDKDFKEAEAKGGEQAISAINKLTRRVNKFRAEVDPTAGKKATTNAGRKLNQGAKPAPTGTKLAPKGTAPAPTGTKLAPKGTAPAPAGTKLAPKGTAPAPAAKPATAPSGFGGKAAPSPTPAAPAPKPATGGSGFGGK